MIRRRNGDARRPNHEGPVSDGRKMDSNGKARAHAPAPTADGEPTAETSKFAGVPERAASMTTPSDGDAGAMRNTPPSSRPGTPPGSEPPAFVLEDAHPAEQVAANSNQATEIPDFEADRRDLEAYDDARRRYERFLIGTAETEIRASFEQKRSQLVTDVAAGKEIEESRRQAALEATRRYASAFPHHVRKTGIDAPTLWENILSIGRAQRLYNAANVATEALDLIRTAIRKREDALDLLDGQLARTIRLKEDQILKHLASDDGIEEFHARAEVRLLAGRVARIRAEREHFAQRLERGEVRDEELRDRRMAEDRLEFLTPPVVGGMIAEVTRYGRLSYLRVRELDRRERLLPYDPRLDPLRSMVFDVYVVADSIAVRFRRTENGSAFRLADHFASMYRDPEKADEAYRAHRATLRDHRGLPATAPRTPIEAQIITKLVALARTVDPMTASDDAGNSTRL